MRTLPKQIVEFYLENKSEILSKLQEFKSVSQEKYFYEMVYCLCTPMSKAENAMKVQKYFETINYCNNPTDPYPILRNPNNYIRFHKQKSKYIIENHQQFNQILAIIQDSMNVEDKRNNLIKIVKGFGMKEASHFLRNIGQFGLPILDRHILRTMQRFEVIEEIPKSISKKNYENLERLYIDWCNYNRLSVEELDLVLWKLQTGKILK